MTETEVESLLRIAAVCVACAGAWTDWKSYRIPNRLTGSCMAAGLILRFLLMGGNGFLTGLAGWGAGALGMVLWSLGAMKAGDIKLYMAIGALGGWKFCFQTEIVSILLGGVVALVLMIRRGGRNHPWRRLWIYWENLFLGGKLTIYEGSKDSQFCFGWIIAAGALAAYFWPL